MACTILVMAKRKYTKRSSYWEKFNQDKPLKAVIASQEEDWNPELNGDSFYEHEAKRAPFLIPLLQRLGVATQYIEVLSLINLLILTMAYYRMILLLKVLMYVIQ